jgi:O-antigen polymerase
MRLYVGRMYKYILLGATVIVSLVGTKFLGSPLLFNVLGFSMLAVIFSLDSILFNANKEFRLGVESKPVLILIVLFLFYLIVTLAKKSLFINLRHVFLLGCILFLTGLITDLKHKRISFAAICNFLLLLCVGESLICFSQYFGFSASLSNQFSVTGTQENPNVTAMFLAISFPALFFSLSNNKKERTMLILISIVISFVAILLLKCRTAAIAVIIASGVYSIHRFELYDMYLKHSRAAKLGLVLFVLSLSIFSAYFFYSIKPASADGRIFIWKNAISVFTKSPVTGVGLGMFEHDYNLQQAKYFDSQGTTNAEIERAAYIKSAYNDYLLQLVEGGTIGFLLYSLFAFTSLLLAFKTWKNTLTKSANLFVLSGVVIFFTMAMINFVFAAVPVVAIFLIYLAELIYQSQNLYKPVTITNNTVFKRMTPGYRHFATLVLCGFICYIGYIFFCYRLATKSNIKYAQGFRTESLAIKKQIVHSLYNDPSILYSYANSLANNADYINAVSYYNKAISLGSNPNYYFSLAKCYEKLGHNADAIIAYKIAINIQPNRLVPRLALMRLYQRNKLYASCVITAEEIISMNVKVPSSTTDSCKLIAQQVLLKAKNEYQ